MADYQAILDEEFEVLESIFPDELEKLGDRKVQILVEPEEASGSQLSLHLIVSYPSTYPDVIPDLSFESIDEETGELSEEEEEKLLESLRQVAEESIGMAMTFTIASAAREALAEVLKDRQRREKEEDDRRAAEYEEMEARKTRGTPVTTASFEAWRRKFLEELRQKRDKEESDRLKALPPKEREDFKRRKERPSGKQLFQSSQALATSDEALYEEGAQEVDMSKYTREEREKERRLEEEEAERARRGLVDGDDDSD
ncbi:ubiquitin-conjugating enzyme/RWD-like protein [Kockovaella imperatae]|uniref:Ubiquitin-conjugating enzyme/RWD-like protein n=1 Tax=Kockovaella imperatae TaxID=4999 RepID=A0A1Y1UM59_9TREE|nr:ubiquitin-conjugating enzyme/RWD-like protein [Kockovaella imperatae]ORX38215.1 ubiquitin-conjugating enzyme/RWD-like protein [Kockovaella imperatae]